MRRLLLGVVIGLLAGGLGMAYLAKRASSVYFAFAMREYQHEEQIAAACAKRDGAMDDAVLHYANVVAMESPEGWAARTEVRHCWPLGFPVTASLIWHWKLFGAFPLYEEPAPAGIVGIYRVQLADALEKAGRKADAETEYARAAALIGGMEKVEVFLRDPSFESIDLLACDAPVPRVEALPALAARKYRAEATTDPAR